MADRSPLAHLGVLVGVTLIITGVVLTLAQFLGVRVLEAAWPLLVIVPGLLLTAASLSAPRGKGLGYLAIPGMLVLVAGLVLEAQALSGDWQSWSYAWALVLPTALGLGLVLAGWRERTRHIRVIGAALTGVGAALFVVAEWFFVRVLEVGGPGLGWWFGLAMPLLLIGLGVVVFALGLRRDR
jgi:uncharacterized membrane protein